MKILIIGENNFNSLETIYRKNFLDLNCKTVNICSFWNPNTNLTKRLLNFFEKYFYQIFCLIQNYKIKKKLQKDKIKYDYVIIFNGYHLDYTTLSIIKKKSLVSLINVQTDNIFQKKNIVLKNLDIFDRVYVWSKFIKDKLLKKKIIQKKKIIFLPFGFDQKIIPKNFKIRINNKILFYGSWDRGREKLLENIDHKILKIFGNGWEKSKDSFKKKYYIRGELVGSKLVSEINNSLFCLNLFRDQAKNFINMRSFEVLGYGGTLLSEQSKEQNSFFWKTSGIVYFNKISQVNRIYKKFIKKKNQLLLARKKNQIKMTKHSYMNRSLFILKNEQVSSSK